MGQFHVGRLKPSHGSTALSTLQIQTQPKLIRTKVRKSVELDRFGKINLA